MTLTDSSPFDFWVLSYLNHNLTDSESSLMSHRLCDSAPSLLSLLHRASLCRHCLAAVTCHSQAHSPLCPATPFRCKSLDSLALPPLATCWRQGRQAQSASTQRHTSCRDIAIMWLGELGLLGCAVAAGTPAWEPGSANHCGQCAIAP